MTVSRCHLASRVNNTSRAHEGCEHRSVLDFVSTPPCNWQVQWLHNGAGGKSVGHGGTTAGSQWDHISFGMELLLRGTMF